MIFSDWLQIVLSLVGFLAGAILSWIFYRAQQTTDFNRLRDSINDLSRFDVSLTHLYESVQQASKNATDIKDSTNLRLGNLDNSMGRLSEAIGQLRESSALSRRRDTATDSRLINLENNLTRILEVMAQVKESADISKKLDGFQEISSLKITIEHLSQTLDTAVDSIITEVRGQQSIISEAVQENFSEQSKKAVRDILGYLKRDLDKVVPSAKERDDLVKKAYEIIEQAINTMGKFQLLILEQQQDNALTSVAERANQQNMIVKEEVQEIGQKVESIERALLPPITIDGYSNEKS